jgi:hypothetical protein
MIAVFAPTLNSLWRPPRNSSRTNTQAAEATDAASGLTANAMITGLERRRIGLLGCANSQIRRHPTRIKDAAGIEGVFDATGERRK